MRRALIFLLLSIVCCGVASAADPTCDTFPPDSLSRIECEKNLAKARRAKEVEEQSAPVNLGIAPSAPTHPADSDFPAHPNFLFPIVYSREYCWNANKHIGEIILLRRLQFKRLIGDGVATFTASASASENLEVLIVDLPADLHLTPYGLYNFLVRGLGITTGRNAYGGPAPTPSASFMENYERGW